MNQGLDGSVGVACGLDSVCPNAVNPTEDRQATIRTLYLSALVDALSEHGHQVDTLLREYGFYRNQTATPYERVPLHRYVSLLEHAARKFDRPYLGLEMGAQFGLEEMGPFHALFVAAGSLRATLDSFGMFQGHWQTRTSLDVTAQAETTTLSYRIQNRAIWPRSQDAEFTMAGMALMLKQLATPGWKPIEVHFEHSIVGREQTLERFFRAPVIGNQVANQLVMRNSDLDRQFSRASGFQDTRLKSVLECHLLDLMGPEVTVAKAVTEQVEEAIARRLGRAPVDCDSIALVLGVSARSLRRRLMEEGASFRSVLQTVRQERAQAMLQSADLPLSVVAEQLGYSDTATFSRAFKEWTRASPRRFSRRQS